VHLAVVPGGQPVLEVPRVLAQLDARHAQGAEAQSLRGALELAAQPRGVEGGG
jgi:hypothetical protein